MHICINPFAFYLYDTQSFYLKDISGYLKWLSRLRNAADKVNQTCTINKTQVYKAMPNAEYSYSVLASGVIQFTCSFFSLHFLFFKCAYLATHR